MKTSKQITLRGRKYIHQLSARSKNALPPTLNIDLALIQVHLTCKSNFSK